MYNLLNIDLVTVINLRVCVGGLPPHINEIFQKILNSLQCYIKRHNHVVQ